MALITREIVVTISVIAENDARAEDIVAGALTPHGSVVTWRIVRSGDSGEELQDAGTGA